MDDQTPRRQPGEPEPPTEQEQPRQRPWVRRTVTLAAAGALTAGVAAIAVPALASDTTSPTPTPSSGYSTQEGAPEGTPEGERGDCPEGEGRGPRPPGERGDAPEGTQPPDTPESQSTEGSSTTSDA